jgi:transcriptional regulator with XRE-family HTH domain
VVRLHRSRTGTIIRLHRLGWTQEKISDQVGLTQNRVTRIINNAIYGNIDNLLKQGRDMAYIASHYQMDMALAFLNADWRNFESTPAAQESPNHAVTLFDYHDLLTQTGRS